MKLRAVIVGVVLTLVVAGTAYAVGFNQASPFQFDPFKTMLVQGSWLSGIGCPTDATVRPFLPDGTIGDPVPFSAGACDAAADSSDRSVEGLLLAKTGPTSNFASSGAILRNVSGISLTELGYDIRKPGSDPSDPRGSHCGAGAPRFNVTTSTGFFFIGCNSPPGTVTDSGDGWIRLRWTTAAGNLPITGTVSSIAILFDEGQDTGGPDFFGLAVLDNIDVNTVLVGRGSTSAN